ncbi:MAG: hypothetical protein H7X99_02425 [Saprospiraceae bacterium]|nr:hypothetical protein [Saprospiraceae bacterium]
MNKKIIVVGVVFLLLVSGFFYGHKKQIMPWNSYDTKLDSLFFDLHFGMKRQAFFDQCMVLNKTYKTTQGSQNTSVLYIDTENFKMPVDMNFYPNFHEDKIFAMPIYFNYKAWAPWNKELYSDSLIYEVKALMEKWYGTGFNEKKLKSGGVAYYKINKPRIITIKIRDEQFVDVLIENVKYGPTDKDKNEQK